MVNLTSGTTARLESRWAPETKHGRRVCTFSLGNVCTGPESYSCPVKGNPAGASAWLAETPGRAHASSGRPLLLRWQRATPGAVGCQAPEPPGRRVRKMNTLL